MKDGVSLKITEEERGPEDWRIFWYVGGPVSKHFFPKFATAFGAPADTLNPEKADTSFFFTSKNNKKHHFPEPPFSKYTKKVHFENEPKIPVPPPLEHFPKKYTEL